MINGEGNEDGKNIKKSNYQKTLLVHFFLVILHDYNAVVLRD